MARSPHLDESRLEDAVDGIVHAIYAEAGELGGGEAADLIARRVAERFGVVEADEADEADEPPALTGRAGGDAETCGACDEPLVDENGDPRACACRRGH
jgi:hypothetical protein